MEHARRAPFHRDALRKEFHNLELAPGVTPKDGLAWYGLRRISTDVAPDYTSDDRVLDMLGEWTHGSSTRKDTYQDRENERLAAEAATTRHAWRTDTTFVTDSVPTSAEALLSVPPDELRNAVLAHFGAVSPATAVGTNADAVGIE